MWSKILIIVFLFGFFFQLTDQTVYITKSLKKYHTENCTSLSKNKITIELSEAIEKGYTPFIRCKPDKNIESTNQNAITPLKKEQFKSINNLSKQHCEATTISGKRFRMKAMAGSKYC
jgi:methylphosphotriester-DNA--protein-cysteine methyltransferase